MNLTVKARIAIAMVALVAVNSVSAAISWQAFRTAERSERTAEQAARLARDAEGTATRLTQFIADSRTLGHTAVRSNVSEDASIAYGRLLGSESEVDAAMRRLQLHAPEGVEELVDGWAQTRDTTYMWVNREATFAGASYRLTRDDAGRYRASTSTNIDEPGRVAAMTDMDLSREVRDSMEMLKNATLRRIVTDAEKAATAAAATARSARDAAITATLGLALLGLVVAAVAATWLYRSIAIPLTQARAYADRVAEGELDAVFEHHRRDEIGALTGAIEEMKNAVVHRIATMREMAGAVLVTAEAVRAEAQSADEPAVVAGADTLLELAGQMLDS